MPRFRDLQTTNRYVCFSPCSMRPVRPGGMECDGSHVNHPLRRRARGIEPRRGREDATSAFGSEESRPDGSKQRCHSPPFSAERPLVTNADRSALRAHFLRWLIAPAFDEPRPPPASAEAAHELHPTFPVRLFGDPGYARDTYEWSPLSRRGQAWCPITSLSSTHVRVSTSRHPHVPRSTLTKPRRRHANRSPFGGDGERLGAFARCRRCRSNPSRGFHLAMKGQGSLEWAPASFPSASRDGEASKRRTMHAASLVTVSGPRRMRRHSTKQQA